MWPEPELLAMQLAMTAILFWRHRSNIRNLIEGKEDKIGASGTKDEKITTENTET